MTASAAPQGTSSTLPPPSPNGSDPKAPKAPRTTETPATSPIPQEPQEPQVPQAPQAPPKSQEAPRVRVRMHTRTSGLRTGLIAGVAVLAVVMIFIIQNAHAVDISFLGAHLRLSLAVALLLAAIAGALLMAAAGTARITQLRQHMRRERHNSRVS
jgi:putative membrane protein